MHTSRGASGMGSGTAKRGQLKVFFGYAAGVGTTHAMLDAARVAAANGRKVLVGCVESRGRPEIEALLLGLPALVVPQEPGHRRGTSGALDLEGVLQRNAELILVDELARSNASGSRHRKRWQDVQELLESGRDVWTTLNVYQIDSLGEAVTQLTGAAVPDTVPDSVFDEAAEVELVDLPPDELLERVRLGGVSLSEKTEPFLRHILNKKSLVALREMAMRRVADRVGRDAQSVRVGEAHVTSSPKGERLLVCVDSGATSARVIRAGARLAVALQARWTALHVEPVGGRQDERSRRDLARNLDLARQLGAETVTLSGGDVAHEIVHYAGSHDVTKIVIGASGVVPWYSFWKRSVADRVIEQSGDLDVHVVRGAREETALSPAIAGARRRAGNYLMAAALVALATVVASAFGMLGLTDANLAMTYLLGIVLIATWWGRGPALAASVASVLLYNFLFTPPYYTLVVADPQSFYTLAVMLSIALIVSALTSRVREQARLALDRERHTEALYRVSHALAGTSGRLQLVAVAQEQLGALFGGQVTVLVPAGGTMRPALPPGHGRTETPEDAAAAQWCMENRRMAGRGTDTFPGAQAIYLPLNVSESTVGVLAWQAEDDAHLSNLAQRQLLDAVSAQVALALERDWLAQETQRVLAEADSERKRSSLLSVVSHDLRTPLAAIAGSASSLVEHDLDADTRRDLAKTIYEEAARLARLVENLLQLTRIESGAMKVDRQWQPVEEVVGSALRRMEAALGRHEVRLDLPPDLPLVAMDGLLIEQVLVNLLENAAKYSAEGSSIDLSARAVSAGVEMCVADRGSGLAESERERIFEEFYRGSSVRGDRGRGAGLGLAICRAIVEAHGGRVWAESRNGGGSCFKFILPVDGAPPGVERAAGAQEEDSHA